MPGKADKGEEPCHPSQSRVIRYPADMLLRKNGYAIHSRPKRGEALWIKGGEVVTQTVALERISEAMH